VHRAVRAAEPGVVERAVQPAELANHLPHGRSHRLLLGNVARHGQRLVTCRAQPTRETLVSAAAELLDRGGPDAVTLREVGHLAGVSHNAPYKHFAGKESLLAAVASAN
jgi:hypothetical protein